MSLEIDKIYLGNCLDLMRDIPDKSIDAIIADPPFGVLHRNNPHAKWDNIIPFEPMWAQYERIIKDDGAILLFGQGLFTAKLMMSNPKLWRYNLVWDKMRGTGFLNANRMPMRCHEDICVFYKKLPVYHPQYTDGKPNHPRGPGKHKETNSCYGKYRQDYQGRTHERVPRAEPTVPKGKKLPRSIIQIKKEHGSRVLHPTQKPVELIRYLIRTYTNEGDVVLDNVIGSGTTALAAIREKRHFIGIEMDGEYYDKACKRIYREIGQQELF